MPMLPAIPTGMSPKCSKASLCSASRWHLSEAVFTVRTFYSNLCWRLTVEFHFKENKIWVVFEWFYTARTGDIEERWRACSHQTVHNFIRIMHLLCEGSLRSHNWLHVPSNTTRTHQAFVHPNTGEVVYTELLWASTWLMRSSSPEQMTISLDPL